MSQMDADLFTRFRKMAKMDRPTLAQALGITVRQVQKIENELLRPSQKVGEKLLALIEQYESDRSGRPQGLNAHGRAAFKKEQRDIHSAQRGQGRYLPTEERLAAKHFRKVRRYKLFCSCVMCSEARLTWCSLLPGAPNFEPMSGGICYMVPVVVWSCRWCAHRWASPNLEYPQKCPSCNSPNWNGFTLERNPNGKPENDSSGTDLRNDGSVALGDDKARSVHQ